MLTFGLGSLEGETEKKLKRMDGLKDLTSAEKATFQKVMTV